MKYLISVFVLIFFLTTIVFTQAQDKQQVKKDIKVEKVKKDDCCSAEKTSNKTKKEACTTDKSKVDDACCSKDEAKADKEDCCKADKSSTKAKEPKN